MKDPSKGTDRRFLAVSFLLAFALVGVSVDGFANHGDSHAYEQTDKLWGTSSHQNLGRSLAADGDLLATGGGVSSVHIYEHEANGTWDDVQVLEAPDNPFADDGPWGNVNGQEFGAALSIDADSGVLAIGAPGLDVTGNVTHHETDAGSVYVYEQADNGTWKLVKRFVGPVNGDWNDGSGGPGLGASVSAQGTTILAGAPAAVVDGESLRGLAEVYERQENGSWMRTEQFRSPSPYAAKWDRFGWGVAVAGPDVAIGSPGEVSGTGSGGGAVHIYEVEDGNWQHSSRLTPALVYAHGEQVRLPSQASAHFHSFDFFGQSLAADGDGSTLVVGAPQGGRLAGVALPTSTDWDATGLPVGALDGPLTHPKGAAFVFKRGASSWSYAATLENPDQEGHSGFGRDVGIDDAGSRIVVGASSANQSDAAGVNVDRGAVTHHPSTGAAYVFERSTGWVCSAQLSGDDTDSEGRFGGDFLGEAVALTGSTTLAGAPMNGADKRGSVYAFDPVGPAPDAVTVGPISRCGPST